MYFFISRFSLKFPFCLDLGHVGAPLPCNLIKLVDVPEKNYFASKGEGEVSEEYSERKIIHIHTKCESIMPFEFNTLKNIDV